MRKIDDIENDIEDLKEKIESLKSEIPLKEKSLQGLKEGNAKLLAMHAGKDRKPQSLNVQIRNIRDSEIEIEQLQAAVKILQGQVEGLEEERHISEIHGDLQTNYFSQVEPYCEKAAQIRSKMTEACDLTEEITKLIKEFMAMPDPLGTLHGLFSRIKSREQYEALGFPWDKEQEKFRQFNKIMVDEKTISGLPKILKYFSDVFFGFENGGAQMASKIRMISDQIPEKSTRRGPVTIGGRGPKVKLESGGTPEIETHPERYTEADVKKFAVNAANRQ